MTRLIPRMRMFAGPNGSGKSTLKTFLDPDLIGIYVNPDDIQYAFFQEGFLDLKNYEISFDIKELITFIESSYLKEKIDVSPLLKALSIHSNKLFIDKDFLNSYLMSVLSDFIRHLLLQAKKSFSFETVMSSHDKIDFLKKSWEAGYRNYLYYVATNNPNINIERVQCRIYQGGHAVPEKKIIERYYRTLSMLPEAITYTNRAFIFDNSGRKMKYLAEVTESDIKNIQLYDHADWFKKIVG